MIHYCHIIKTNSHKRHHRAAQRAQSNTAENVLVLQIAVRWFGTKGQGAAETPAGKIPLYDSRAMLILGEITAELCGMDQNGTLKRMI